MTLDSPTKHKPQSRKELVVASNKPGQAEPALPHDSALFSRMFYNNPLPMWLFDTTTLQFVEVNSAAVQHYDYTREEFLGMSLLDIRPPEQVPALLGHLSTLTDNGQVEFTGQHIKKNGDVIDVLVTGLTLRPNISSVIAQDITERKKTKTELAHLAAIVESSEDAVIGKTLEGIIVSWNHSAERMYGYTAEEVIGLSVSIIMPPERKNDLPQILEKIRKGERVAHYETIRRRKDGTHLHISLSVSPIKDSAGNITGASAVARDITERYELDRRKSEFLSLASHELRTPVSVIRGFSQLGLKFAAQSGDQKLIHALQGINENTTHITRLITDLLDVSRIERDTLPIHSEELDLRVPVEKTTEDMKLLLPDLVYTLDLPAESVMVNADKDLIRQVINNLIENSVKYSHGEMKVEVRIALSGQEAITSIRDFGIGIPSEEQAKVFDRFYRATNASPRSRNGLGLGLFITKDIVERHGGRIWLESTSGAGSTFYFSLPLLR